MTCQPLRLTAGATPGLPTPTKDMSDVSPAAAAAATAADLEVVDLVSRDMDDAAAAAAQLLHPSRRKSMASARVSQV